MTNELFDTIKEKYGKYSSWTLWDENNRAGMNWLADKDLLEKLSTNYVFVGLNCSSPANKKIPPIFGNFHSKDVNIKKLCEALENTKFKGCYITDIIKCLNESKSEILSEYLKKNPDYEKKQIQIFMEEIGYFGKPILLALGKTTYNILKRNHIDKEFRVVYIWHYSCRKNSSFYKEKIKQQLQENNLW
ncbi:MAG: hypothetical protein K6F69_07440 [Treponema sp.]|nr:hypothetical protein [Treponema sp.]